MVTSINFSYYYIYPMTQELRDHSHPSTAWYQTQNYRQQVDNSQLSSGLQARVARSQYLSNVPQVNINLVSTGDPSISPPNPLRSPLPHPQIQRILDQFVPRLVSGGINDMNHFKRKKRYRN